MHRISRAPELSATRSLVSCCITVSPGLLQDLEQPPALRARQRPRLDDANDIALLRLVGLVVSMEPAGPADDLLVGRVAPDDRDLHRDRLVAAGRDHGALANLLRARLARGGGSPGARLAALAPAG